MKLLHATADQYIYFVAVDATDLKSREDGMTTNTFRVYGSRDGGSKIDMNPSPHDNVTEVDATDMPGVYKLLLDVADSVEMTSGNATEEIVIHIDDTGGVMAPVTRVIELFRSEWDRPAGSHNDANSFGAYSSGSSATQLAHEFWKLQTDSHADVTAAGSFGKALTDVDVDGAIVTYGLDHLVQTSVAGTDIANNSIIAKLVSKSAPADWDDFQNTTDSLEAIKDNQQAAAAAALVAINLNYLMKDAVADENNMTAEVADESVLCNIMTATQDTSDYDHALHSLNAGPKWALQEYNLDHLMAVTAADSDIINGSVIAQLAASGTPANWSGFNNTHDSLQAIRENGDTAWVTATGFNTTTPPTASAIYSHFTTSTNANAFKADVSGLSTLSASDVNAQCDLAIETYGLDHLVSASVADEVVNDSIIAKLVSKDATADWSDFNNTTDSLEAIKDHSVDTKVNIDLILGDTSELQSDDVPGLIAALNNISAAQVNTQVDTALSDIHLDHLLAVAYDDEGHAESLLRDLTEDNSGTFRFTAAALAEAPSGTGASAASIADAVWDEDTTGHTTGGTFGAQCATDIDAILVDTGTTLDGIVDDIKTAVVTNAAGDDIADDIIAIKAETAEILLDTAVIGAAGAGLTDLGGMSTGMKAEILVEALKVLQATAMPEPGAGAPAASPNLDDAIMYLYMALRNKLTVTSTFKTLHNSSDVALYKKPLGDDGSTFTESESTTI